MKDQTNRQLRQQRRETSRQEQIRNYRQSLIGAVLTTAVAALIPWLLWHEYSWVSALYDGGVEGILSIDSLVATAAGGRGTTIYTYDAELAGKAIRICTGHELQVAGHYQVLYLTGKLRDRPATTHCRDYLFVGESKSRWECFVHAIGRTRGIFVIACLEAMFIAIGWYHWRRLRHRGRPSIWL